MSVSSKRLSSLQWILIRSGAFLARDLRFETSYRLQSLFRLISVLFQVLTFYFLAGLVDGEEPRKHLADYGGDYFTFALVGLAFSGFLNSGLLAFTTSLRQQMTMGVFEAMAAAPIRSSSFLMYSLQWPIGFELFKSIFYLVVGQTLLGARVGLASWPLLLGTLVLSVLVFGSMGIIAGSLILYFKRGDPIAWFLSSANHLIGGIIFPVTVLPGWLAWISRLLPVPYALNSLRKSLIPAADRSDVAGDLVVLGLFALISIPIALWAARVAVERCRREGTLGQF